MREPTTTAGPHPTPESPVLQTLQRLHRELSQVHDGNVATYIPELAKANPDWFGICLVTTNGSVYEVGDTAQPFTIQSISKPFVYGMALEDCSRDAVLQKVGVEPTGDAFNSISLEPGTGRPRNPMINAGAIATAGLIGGRPDIRLRRVVETFSKYAGRPLTLDKSVYRSENETGHRNRAIGHMLRNFDILTSDPIPVVDLYFQQCSISVTCHDLAVMAATLANQGVNPLTGQRALRGEYVESVLSVMETCGMYDFAGEWVYKVGMPAKSGVAGGIVAVLPGQLGIGVFSPRLDAHGNSVRGIRVCEELSRRFDLHQLSRPGVGRSTIRLKFTAAEFNSSRVRTAAERQVLRDSGSRVRVWQLQGHLTFPTVEVIIRDILAHAHETDDAILDLRRVLTVNECACGMLYQLLRNFVGSGRTLIFTSIGRIPLLQRVFRFKLGTQYAHDFRRFDNVEHALEWCEDRILNAALGQRPVEEHVPYADFPFFNGFTAEEIAVVQRLFTRHTYAAGETIICAGDEAQEMFLLVRGRVSVQTTGATGETRRIATVQAGMIFGEIALIDGAPRSAMIVADTIAECDRLRRDDLEALDHTHPGIKLKLWRNLCVDVCGRLRKASRELSALE